MTCTAYAHLQHRRLDQPWMPQRKTTMCLPGLPPSPSLLAVRQAIIERIFAALTPSARCPHCQRCFTLQSDLNAPV
jgi:hypothetical protein